VALSASSRYWLAQVPGWMVAGAALWFLWEQLGVPGWLAGLVFAGFVVKDLVFYPFAVRTLEAPARAGWEGLIGRRATVLDPLEPVGRVSLEGEAWRAEAVPGSGFVGRRATVVVEGVAGLTLRVRPEREARAETPEGRPSAREGG